MRHLVGLAKSGAAAPAAALAVFLLAGAAPSARADWLVLSSGEPVETKGSWTVEGRKVIFTTTRGVLSSIRTSSVDIESSRALTEEKQAEATRKVVADPVPRRAPVLVLTDSDFASSSSPTGEGTAPLASAAAGAEAEASAAGAGEPIVVPAADQLETRVGYQLPGTPSLRIMNWSARPTGENELSILGYVQNVGNLVSVAVSVTVTLFDSEGAQVGSSEAALSSTALMPGVQAFFEAKFPGSPNFIRLEFALSTVELEVGREGGGAEPEVDSGTDEGSADGGEDRLPAAELREAPAGASPRSP